MINRYILLASINVFISSLTQILLKSSANEKKESFIKNFLNYKVIIAYVIFFGVMLINSLIVFKHIDLSQISIIPILSSLFLKEKISKKKIYGIILIIIGIFLFNL